MKQLGIYIGGGVKKDQYSYLSVFIGYLNDILEMIKGLISFLFNLGKDTSSAVSGTDPQG